MSVSTDKRTQVTRTRVLMVGPSPVRTKGGMATVIDELGSDPMLNSMYDIDVYESYIDGGLFRRLAFSAWSYLRFLAVGRGYDIYHIHVASHGSTFRKFRYASAAKRWGKKVILHAHGAGYKEFFQESSERQRGKIVELFGMADRVIVLSEEWRDWFAESVCDSERIDVLHNAVCVPAEAVDVHARRDVLFLGRLGVRKSPDVLLRAAKIVLEKCPDVRFRFGGDGDVGKYREMAIELEIDEKCEFLGWVAGEQRESLLRESGIYCLPSQSEGMPMSVLEAMAYGLATVATPVGGVPQIIEDGVNGYLTPVGDSDVLAELLLKLIRDVDVRVGLAAAGRQTVQERFNLAKNIKQLAVLYARCQSPAEPACGLEARMEQKDEVVRVVG